MGIQGLLPFVKEATQPVNMRKYCGYAVAVDTYCWLHKGAFACSLQLAKGEPTHVYVRYCLKFVNMLRSMGVRPILVFDGCTLPAKKHVEKSRRERRELYNKKGRQFLREGKVSEARDCFNKCVNVTPQMALQVMKAVRTLGVDCIVAPYEADAQLAYLHKMGIVQAVITEDSDLIAFGCKRVIVKLDLNGNGLEIESSKLNDSMKIGPKYTMEKFRYMCIVAGCDYLPSLPGVGLGKARKLFKLVTNPDITQVIQRMRAILNLKQSVPAEYVEGFHKANNTFLHQLAFDPRRRKLVPLHPYPEGTDPKTMEYAGKYLPDYEAYQTALGNLDINTMQKIYDFEPNRTEKYERGFARHKLSIWHKDYRIGPDLEDEDLKEVERHNTKGKEVTLRTKPFKRPREDEVPEELPSDTDLASMYATSSAAKRKLLEPPSQPSIPETPSPCKIRSSQQIAAEKLLERAKSPKRSPLKRRNIFAVKGRKNWDRNSHLKETEMLASRFFAPQPQNEEQAEPQETVVTIEIQLPSAEDGYENEGLDMQVSDNHEEEPLSDEEPVKSEWAWGNAEPSNSARKSTLDRLQTYRRNATSHMPSIRIKDEVETIDLSAGVKNEGILLYVKPEQKNEEIRETEMIGEIEETGPEAKATDSQSSSRSSTGTPKGRSAFSWSEKKPDKQKKTFVNLDKFSRTYSKAGQRLNIKRDETKDEEISTQESHEESPEANGTFSSEQYSQSSNVSDQFSFNKGESSQEGDSQCSNSVSMSQASDLYSMDADAVSYSQFGISRQNTPLNSQITSQGSINSLPVDICEDVGDQSQRPDENTVKQKSLYNPKLPSLGDFDTDLDQPSQENSAEKNTPSSQSVPKLPSTPDVEDNGQNSQRSSGAINLFSNTKRKTLKHFYSAPILTSSTKVKRKASIVGTSSSYFSKGRTNDETKDSSGNEKSSDDVSDSATNSEGEEKKYTDCIDLTDDDDFGSEQKKNNKGNETKTLLKKTLSSSKLQGACKPSGLSKKRKKPTNKKTNENAGGQTKIFSFMKKTQEKKESEKKTNPSDGPLSPVKTNIVQDETPDCDGSLVKKDIKKVQRVIFS